VLWWAIAFVTFSSVARADIDNNAVATGTYGGAPVTSNTSASSVPVDGTPLLLVEKTAVVNTGSDGRPDAGDTVSYTITVRNTGSLTLQNVVTSDPLLTLSAATLSDDVAPLGDSTSGAAAGNILAPGDALSYTGTYTLTVADIAAGQISNTATATATTTTGTPVNGSGTLVTPLTAQPGLSLDKTAVADFGSDGIANAGDTIAYQFLVTNTGNVALTNVRIDDPLLMAAAAEAAGMDRVLALLEDASLQTDPIATASVGQALAMSRHPHMPLSSPPPKQLHVAQPHEPAFIGPRILPPEMRAAIHGTRKLVNLTGAADTAGLGDLVGIYVELVNTGDVPLTNIMVQQDGAEAFGNLLEYLAPNESNKANVIFTREVTEADLAAGELLLPATITANTRGRTITIGLSDSLPLTGLAARDALVTASIDPANIPTLGPGENFTFTSTYVITQADVDAGHVVNNATAIGVDPSNQDVTATDSTDTPLPPVPSIALVKSGTLDLGADAVASVGDLITYQFSVTNTGNVTLDDITVTDPLVTVAGGPLSGLLPGATDSTTFTATYALTQADIDAGQVQNQATASGTPPGGGTPVTDLSDESDETGNDPTITPIDGVPKITLLKQVASVEDINNNGLTDAGDEIRYRFVVANTGNVTLENVAVVDQNANVSVTPAAPTGVTLAPGTTDSTTFTGTYVLQQVDVDAGFFENTADVTGDVPGSGTGAQATDQSHPDDPDADGPTRHDIPAEPGIALLKREVSVTDTNGNGINDISDIINYAFTVTNTGNVTLTNITLTDANASLVGGPIASLAPGATDTTTFNATHEITAADMVAGSVVNSATAQGNTSSGGNVTDVSDPDDITEDDPTITAVVVNPAIAVVKTAQSVATNDQGTPLNPLDDTLEITYAFTVTNTGNVTLTNIQITDPLVTVTGSLATLDPAESDSTTFQAVYTVTPADITAGQVVNQATVSGLDPSNTPVTDLSDDTSTLENDPTITPLANQPGIALVKTFDSFIDVNSNSVTDAGDGIRYTLAVTNTGNVALSNVTVSDPAAVVSGGPLLSLPVGGVDTTTFSAIHTLTQPEIDAGTFQNQATASASSTAGPVTDLSDESSTTGDDPTVVPLTVPPPQIALVKTVSSITDANGNGATDQGDTINYAFTVYNTGVVTLFNVTLTDVNAVVSGGPIVSLGPGSNDATTFTGSHVVTASDIVAGQVTNQATAQGASAFGIVVADESDNANVTGDNPTVTPVAAPGVVLSKTAARSEIRRGERVTYTITASNLGAGPYDLADLMPAGFSYVAGSATINDVAATPAISGNTLSFANLTPVAGKITLKLSLLASATLSNGEFTNRARLFLNATGVLLAEASAKVTIKEEHVFDCGEIIGKVFDDLNCNGYADAGEPGIPAVRVATVKGLLITTDKHGRYHLSCADVPNAAIGSNFLMKLDTRTLPQGYGLTTENPRDVRLTRGKLTKLNFGACRKRDLNLDITRDAFAGNGLELKDKWNAGIDRLVRLMQQGGSDLTITYRCTSHAPIADRRVAHVKQLIRTRWIEKGGTSPLNIETRVECGR
jgi:uncharacterized repeat protein (TIGR01451 family)